MPSISRYRMHCYVGKLCGRARFIWFCTHGMLPVILTTAGLTAELTCCTMSFGTSNFISKGLGLLLSCCCLAVAVSHAAANQSTPGLDSSLLPKPLLHTCTLQALLEGVLACWRRPSDHWPTNRTPLSSCIACHQYMPWGAFFFCPMSLCWYTCPALLSVFNGSAGQTTSSFGMGQCHFHVFA